MMNRSLQQRAIRSLIGIAIAAALIYSPVKRMPLVDSGTDDYFGEAITKAGVAYATARAINASVSVIKESNLQLEPAGIGVSLAIGQLLDPVDDMTERLSAVLVTAITSLGVQKLSYDIGVSLAPAAAAILLLALSVLVWTGNSRAAALQFFLVRLLVLVAALRFCLPLSSLANVYIYETYFAQQIAETSDELQLQTRDFDQFENLSLPESSGIIGAIENSGSFIKQKSLAFKNALHGSVTNMAAIIDNLLQLTFLYVGIFFLQVMIFPLLIFWIIVKIAGTLFRTNPS